MDVCIGAKRQDSSPFLLDIYKHDKVQTPTNVGKHNNKYVDNRRHVIRDDLPNSVDRDGPPLDREHGDKHRHGFCCLDVCCSRLRLLTNNTSDLMSNPSDVKPREQVESSVDQYNEDTWYGRHKERTQPRPQTKQVC